MTCITRRSRFERLEGRFVIEMGRFPAGKTAERGVVAQGPVGARVAGRLRIFRYGVRRWRDGVIPDLAEAVDSPRLLSDDPEAARRLLELVPAVPTPVWGRDQLHAGEMWNSNSLTSWLITRSGLDIDSIEPPARGRAPGWKAGIVVARRQEEQTGQSLADSSLPAAFHFLQMRFSSYGSPAPTRLRSACPGTPGRTSGG